VLGLPFGGGFDSFHVSSVFGLMTKLQAGQIGHPTTADAATVDWAFPPTMGELSFESGGCKLNGFMYVANGPGPHPTVVILHGYPGNERNLDPARA